MNDTKVKTSFNWEIATWMAKLSMHAYQKESGFKKAMKPLGSWKVKYFDFGGTQAYALNGKKNFVLVFRGTQPTQWADIKADLKFRKEISISSDGVREGKVHRGCKDALNEIWDDILKHMKKCDTKDKNILITGHSLGAALATLVAGRLNDPTVVLYTFGSPRVGDGKWNSMQKFTHYRFRNNNDIVTRVPPRWIGFKHNGELNYFDYKDMVNTGSGSWYMMKNWFMGLYRSLFSLRTWDSFSDHDISTYYKLCKNQMIDND